ncbi:MAG: DUF5671 domain-containing protein [Dehalococcoidia bacterium]
MAALLPAEVGALMVSGILFTVLFAALPIGIVAAVLSVAATARDARDERAPDDPGIGTVRRLFVYVLAFLGLMFAATGVSLLITGVLEVVIERVIVSQRSEALSTALAFTVVGTPAWVVFALLAQRSLAQHPAEAWALTRRLYFVVVRGVAITFIAFNAGGVGRQIAGLDPVLSHAWGWLLTWGGVWLVHARLTAGEPAPSAVTRLLERLSWYYGAVLGLGFALNGIATLVRTPLGSAYNAASSTALVDASLSTGLREGTVELLVGAVLWGTHWIVRLLHRDRRTTLWHVQVFVFGTLPGVALTVVPVAVLLYTTLEWFMGTPDVDSASAQFAEVPSLLGALVAGVATWGYHRAALVEATRDIDAQGEPERVYRYAVAAAGLVTAAIGLATVIAVACEALGGGGSLVRETGWWRNPLIRAATLLVVGAPLWAWYWQGLQRTLPLAAGARTSLSRRAFLFAAVGVSVAALLVSLVVLLFQVFRPLLDGDLSLATLDDARWSIATAATSAFVGIYYLLVQREDQTATRASAEAGTGRAPVRVRNVVLLAPEGAEAAADALREIEGVRLREWRRVDATIAGLSPMQLDALRDTVTSVDADRVVVLVLGDRFEVVPYTEA